MKLPKLSLGGAQLGGQYGSLSLADATRLIRTAIDRGVNLIDTSPYYGVTQSETVIGQALAGLNRDRFLLATKCGRYDLADFDFSPARITRSIDESLARLGLDYVDIFQLHDIEFTALPRILDESLPALEKIKQSGKARAIGVTGLPLKIFETVLPRYPLDTIISYAHYTLFDTTLTSILPLTQPRGIQVLNASPVALGMLSPHGPPPWHPAPAALKEFVARVVAKWQAQGVSLAKLSLQHSLAQPAIASTITGVASLAELENALSALSDPLDDELLAAVRADFAPVLDGTWPQGLAENN